MMLLLRRAIRGECTLGRRVCIVASMSCVVLTGCADLFGGPNDSHLVQRIWFQPLQFPFLWPASPAVDGGVVMFFDGKGIAAFDTASGAPKWRATMFPNRAGNAGDIVAMSGTACITDNFGGSGCVEVRNGRVIWTLPSDDSWGYQHAGDTSGFFYGTHEHQVLARNPRDGALLWRVDVASGAPFQTVVRGVALTRDTLFTTTTRWLNANGFLSTGDLIAMDRVSGREIWRFTPAGDKSDLQVGPVISRSIAIVSDTYSHNLRAINLMTHQQIWQTATDSAGYVDAESPPVIHADTVFVASSDTQIHAYDIATGQLLWRVPGGAGSLGVTAICGRLVLAIPWTSGPLVVVDRSTLHVAQPHVLVDGDELFSRLAVQGNTAYVAGTKGVYAFRCAE